MAVARKDKLIHAINLQGKGLEIGPLCWPVLTKSEANIQYVDHTTTEGLKRLYKKDKGIQQQEIVAIDYPLNSRSLKETVGRKKFDYILASHVVEHVPDMIAWLKDMASVLTEGGVLSLAIPDKRFTFDIDRNVSRPADIIGAHLDGLTKPSSVTVFDYFLNYRSKVDPRQAWEGRLYLSEEAGPHRYNAAEAKRYCLINRDTDEYVDTHCFVYTPASLFEALKIAMELSLIPFEVADFYDTAEGEYEFFVSFRKNTAKSAKLVDSLPKLDREPTQRELQARITELEQLLDEKTRQLDHILASKSWVMTKPLRYTKRAASKLKKK